MSRLIGAPPGYVGYEEGGLLIDAVRKSPHAVLLLDEIEKAHPDLFSILLQVMDHATLTDTHGRKADFRHVILIMTTNAGARDLSGRKMGFGDAGAGQQGHRRARADVLAGVPQPARRHRALPAARRGGDRARRRQAHRRAARAWWPARQITHRRSTPAARDVAGRRKGFDRAFGARPMARLIERIDQEAAVGGAAVLGPGGGHDGDGGRSGRGDPLCRRAVDDGDLDRPLPRRRRRPVHDAGACAAARPRCTACSRRSMPRSARRCRTRWPGPSTRLPAWSSPVAAAQTSRG